VRQARRDGPRIILTGGAPTVPKVDFQLALFVSNGTIRFHDLGLRGRSIPHLDTQSGLAEQTGIAGVNSVGDLFRLLFDLKACRA